MLVWKIAWRNVWRHQGKSLVIGVILGPMADENLRRALMVSQGSFMPVFTRPVSLILFLIIVWTVISQFQFYKHFKARLVHWIFNRNA